MRYLNLTLTTPAANLALDDVLLDWAEEEDSGGEFLRIWESPEPVVVLGRSSRVDREANEAACSKRSIPILRRSSGGAAIVAGPGCLMYAVILSYQRRPQLRAIDQAHKFVLGQLERGLKPYVENVQQAGTSDLVLRSEATASPARKFSGNSLRARRSHCLYHGTLLYNFDLTLLATCLRMPPRQPDYRQAREHTDFVANLPISGKTLAEAILSPWPIQERLTHWPLQRVDQLVEERFGRAEWNLQFPSHE